MGSEGASSLQLPAHWNKTSGYILLTEMIDKTLTEIIFIATRVQGSNPAHVLKFEHSFCVQGFVHVLMMQYALVFFCTWVATFMLPPKAQEVIGLANTASLVREGMTYELVASPQ